MTIIETASAPQAHQQGNLLLDVKDLRVTFKTPDGDVTAVNDLPPLMVSRPLTCRRTSLTSCVPSRYL